MLILVPSNPKLVQKQHVSKWVDFMKISSPVSSLLLSQQSWKGQGTEFRAPGWVLPPSYYPLAPSSLAHSRNTICRSFYHLSCKGKVIGSTSQQCLNTQGAAHSRYCRHGRSSLCEFNSLQNGPLRSSVQLDQFKSPFLSCKANWYFFPPKNELSASFPHLLHSKGFLIASHFPQACALIRYFAVMCSGLSFSRTSDWKRPSCRTSGCLSPRKWGSWLRPRCAVTVASSLDVARQRMRNKAHSDSYITADIRMTPFLMLSGRRRLQTQLHSLPRTSY